MVSLCLLCVLHPCAMKRGRHHGTKLESSKDFKGNSYLDFVDFRITYFLGKPTNDCLIIRKKPYNLILILLWRWMDYSYLSTFTIFGDYWHWFRHAASLAGVWANAMPSWPIVVLSWAMDNGQQLHQQLLKFEWSSCSLTRLYWCWNTGIHGIPKVGGYDNCLVAPTLPYYVARLLVHNKGPNWQKQSRTCQ